MRNEGLDERITVTLVAVLGEGGNATVRRRFRSTQRLGHLVGGGEARTGIEQMHPARERLRPHQASSAVGRHPRTVMEHQGQALLPQVLVSHRPGAAPRREFFLPAAMSRSLLL